MPFVEKNLDGFLTVENAESAEKKSPRKDTRPPRLSGSRLREGGFTQI